jgi:hypothetical protein
LVENPDADLAEPSKDWGVVAVHNGGHFSFGVPLNLWVNGGNLTGVDRDVDMVVYLDIGVVLLLDFSIAEFVVCEDTIGSIMRPVDC